MGLLLMYNVPKSNPVIYYREILAIFIVFATILYLLYPSDKIVELAKKEKNNIDLAIIYLEKIVKSHPKDSSLWFRLYELYLNNNQFKKAENILEKMEDKKAYQYKKLLYLRYKLYRYRYYNSEERDKTKILNKLKLVSKDLISYFSDNTEILKQFYKDYLGLNMPKLALNISKKIANIYKKRDDLKNYQIWLEKSYKQSLAVSDIDSAITVLEDLIKINPNDSRNFERLSELYLAKKDLENAINIYLALAEIEKNKKAKKRYILKAIKLYRYQNRVKKAAQIAKKYEKYIIENKEDIKFLIELYMAANRNDFAKSLVLDYINRLGI